MKNTAPAVEGLFRLLNECGWQKMRAFIDFANNTTQEQLARRVDDFASADVSREVLAGSIIQIAYFAINRYGVQKRKSANALHFESEMNRLILEVKNPRSIEPFALPEKFCIGREIGHLPLGIVIYAARNQYNHFDEQKRLSRVNEVVFNHLHQLFPDLGNGLSFDIYKSKAFRCYATLLALGWSANANDLGYQAYKRDLAEILQIEA